MEGYGVKGADVFPILLSWLEYFYKTLKQLCIFRELRYGPYII